MRDVRRRRGQEALLTVREIESLKSPGRYLDGAGLYVLVTDQGVKRWELRVSINGKRREFGLGLFNRKELSRVRQRAREIREGARQGRDVVAEEKHERRRATTEASGSQTFRTVFADFWVLKEPTLQNAKHRQQWLNTMRDYVFPVIGDRPVDGVTPDEIIAVLHPNWRSKAETAGRVLQRVRAIFDVAIVRQLRTAANPCTGVERILGPQQKRVVSRQALPWQDVPRFIVDLRAGPATPITRLAFEFLILTAARSGEVRGAVWDEIDFDEATWTMPAERMKARRDHRVPLSTRALDILAQAKRRGGSEDLVFPSSAGGQLSDSTFSKLCRDAGEPCTPHGFRSSFRTWAAENGVSREVAEACLAHAVENKVEAAYQRSDYLEQRRPVMEDWGHRCASCLPNNWNPPGKSDKPI